MSFFGYINDKLTGNPVGTADAASAANDAANAKLAELNAKVSANIAATQGQSAADAYDTQVTGDFATGAPDPNSIEAGAQIAAGFGSGLVDGLEHPVDSFVNGLAWEGQVVGDIAGKVGNGASNAVWDAIKRFLKQIPWFVYVALVIGIFLYLGGGGFLARKARRKLST